MHIMENTFESELTDFMVMMIMLNPYYFHHNVKFEPKCEAPILNLNTSECRKVIRRTFARVSHRYKVLTKKKNFEMLPMLVMWYITVKENDFALRDITSKNNVPKFTTDFISQKWSVREFRVKKFLKRYDVAKWMENPHGIVKLPKWNR